ncbi:hypothetical protein EAD89_30005, partial [Micromonospora sp. BL4]
MTVSFEEYAALARQLAEQRRAGERDAAVESERRRDLHAAADYLHQRLTAQGHRLDQLGRAIGVDQPAAVPPPAPGHAGPTSAPGQPDSPPAPGYPGAGGAPGYPDPTPGPGDGEPAGAAG